VSWNGDGEPTRRSASTARWIDTKISLKRDFTLDALVLRVEEAIIREYEKGGTAASAKAAVDRVLDQLHNHSDWSGVPAREALRDAFEAISRRVGKTGRER
jgi:hypothetical protein